jgi:hypothetical protein
MKKLSCCASVASYGIYVWQLSHQRINAGSFEHRFFIEREFLGFNKLVWISSKSITRPFQLFSMELVDIS